MPLTTTTVAFGDMTSLIEGARTNGRWQAFFVPSPAGAIETATLGFAGRTGARLPAGTGVAAANGALFATETARPAFDTPDEARVNRGEKTGRVLAVQPFAPPKAFSAGSILERQSMLRPAPAEDGVRSAFRHDEGTAEALVQMAMNFAPSAAEPAPGATMVAALHAKPAKLSPVAKQQAPGLVKVASAAAVPDTAALGYAPAEPAVNPASTLFGRILRGDGGKGFVPPIGRKDHAWAATPLPGAAFSAKEQLCLANGIYFEARGEPELGQAAVAQVILNRVRNPSYPKTICGVVYQNQSWRNRCQFSFACDGIKKRVTNKRAFSTAMRIAGEVTRGETWLAEVGSATHYHATYVRPRWASAMVEVDKIGRHIFYRTYGGGWN